MLRSSTQPLPNIPEMNTSQLQLYQGIAPPSYSPHSSNFNMNTCKNGLKIPAHSTFVLKCRYRPNGLAVATTSADQTTKIWSTTNYKLVKILGIIDNSFS